MEWLKTTMFVKTLKNMLNIKKKNILKIVFLLKLMVLRTSLKVQTRGGAKYLECFERIGITRTKNYHNDYNSKN